MAPVIGGHFRFGRSRIEVPSEFRLRGEKDHTPAKRKAKIVENMDFFSTQHEQQLTA